MPMKTLVTGGAGFIGSHVAKHLAADGHDVVVVDDLTGGFTDNVPVGCTFVQGSVSDSSFMERLFEQHEFDYLFHLAPYGAGGLSHFIRRFNYTNNVIGSMNLINEAVRHEVKCFVFTSSIAVYGAEQVPMTEDTVPRPEDPYGIAKYAVEQDLHAAHRMFGLDHVIFRPHNVYGEFQNIGDRYRNVVGIFMNQLMRGEPLTVFGDGNQTRAFSYIADVAPYIAASVDVPAAYNEVFNIGADQPFSVNELATRVGEAMGIEAAIRHLPARKEVVDALADHSKAQRVFDMSPPIPLQEGLDRMAEWALRVGPRRGEKFGDIELTRELPPVWLEACAQSA